MLNTSLSAPFPAAHSRQLAPQLARVHEGSDRFQLFILFSWSETQIWCLILCFHCTASVLDATFKEPAPGPRLVFGISSIKFFCDQEAEKASGAPAGQNFWLQRVPHLVQVRRFWLILMSFFQHLRRSCLALTVKKIPLSISL